MSQFIVLPRIEVRNANAQPVWWMVGPPPITAYLGFAHALALRLGAPTHEGVAVVHHDIQFLGEMFHGTLYPNQFRAASFVDNDDYSSKNRYVLSSQPTARCHLEVSLVVQLADDATFGLEEISRFLRGARLAGGSIIDHRAPKHVYDDNASTDASTAIGSGFSVTERQDLMALAHGDRDMLDVVLRVTRPIEKRIENQEWLMPTALGYLEITERKQRAKARGGMLHAYAEPLIGLVQYRPLRTTGLHFWRYHQPISSAFVATTH